MLLLLLQRAAITTLAVLIHLALFFGVLFIFLEISKPWIIAIAASSILSQLLFSLIIIGSITLSFIGYIAIGRLVLTQLERR